MKQQIDRQLREACDEAFRRAYRGRNTGAAPLREVSIREPGQRATGQRASESATSSGFVNLKESDTMSTQPATPQQRMTEAFKRLGYSDEAAETAAAGRGNEPIGVGDAIPTSMREALNRAPSDAHLFSGTVVIHHGDAKQLQEAQRHEEVREAERKVAADNHARMKQNFIGMGLSESAAEIAARGRGYSR